jgi:RNA recognition motif-containing protein
MADVLDSSWLFVDGLPLNYTASDLQALFAQVGAVVSCRLVTDGTGQSLRCGYVEMASHREAERALLLQLKTFGMTALEDFRIVHALPPT